MGDRPYTTLLSRGTSGSGSAGSGANVFPLPGTKSPRLGGPDSPSPIARAPTTRPIFRFWAAAGFWGPKIGLLRHSCPEALLLTVPRAPLVSAVLFFFFPPSPAKQSVSVKPRKNSGGAASLARESRDAPLPPAQASGALAF